MRHEGNELILQLNLSVICSLVLLYLRVSVSEAAGQAAPRPHSKSGIEAEP